MNVIYTTTITCRCPVDDTLDVYDLIVQSDRMIPVESILTAVKNATRAPEFQETITEAVAYKLGCTVTTVGTHSGVLTTATVEGVF